MPFFYNKLTFCGGRGSPWSFLVCPTATTPPQFLMHQYKQPLKKVQRIGERKQINHMREIDTRHHDFPCVLADLAEEYELRSCATLWAFCVIAGEEEFEDGSLNGFQLVKRLVQFITVMLERLFFLKAFLVALVFLKWSKNQSRWRYLLNQTIIYVKAHTCICCLKTYYPVKEKTKKRTTLFSF